MNCPAGHKTQFNLRSAARNHARSANHDAQRQFIQRRKAMADNQLVILSKAFSVDIIRLCENLRERKKATAILNQLLRSDTSIGANIHEANYASSKADFINKFQIALKECYETDYWLDIFHNAGIITDEEYVVMFAQCSKIRKLLIASITTAKNTQSENQ
jgi:four helix bundle protein